MELADLDTNVRLAKSHRQTREHILREECLYCKERVIAGQPNRLAKRFSGQCTHIGLAHDWCIPEVCRENPGLIPGGKV